MFGKSSVERESSNRREGRLQRAAPTLLLGGNSNASLVRDGRKESFLGVFALVSGLNQPKSNLQLVQQKERRNPD